jgi:hypothetical protein
LSHFILTQSLNLHSEVHTELFTLSTLQRTKYLTFGALQGGMHFNFHAVQKNKWEQAVKQLVEALHYNSKGCGFDSRYIIGIFIDIILSAALWSWVRTQPLAEMITRNIS